MGVADAKFSAKFLGSLPHPLKSDSDTVRPQIHDLVRESLAVITHHDNYPALFLTHDNPTLAGLRMAKDVGQGFLYDAKDRGLHVHDKSGELLRLDIERDVDPAALVYAVQVA